MRITPRGSQERGIILPEEAVQQIEGSDMVFVQVKGGFQAVPVSVGSRSGGRIEILDGLRAGQIGRHRGRIRPQVAARRERSGALMPAARAALPLLPTGSSER